MANELGTVTRCVRELWEFRGDPPPTLFAIRLRRYWLWHAVAQELEWRMEHPSADYDPDRDHRVTWARQFLEVLGGERQAVDADVEATAESLIAPTPFTPSGKDLAAGERAASA